ncbi:integral membrane protein [Klebsormidium nitens]|uniref:Integral membrane protein n=1 Tax=Klebsormidium nitens TaxID=105231 RepID=A0A1Y1IHD0_KLENI|nr:integral membrane protein [Klebsormidium nitens]|eukprot:GAQ87538.1 integral membrane protein [Klebsormidium nitens]
MASAHCLLAQKCTLGSPALVHHLPGASNRLESSCNPDLFVSAAHAPHGHPELRRRAAGLDGAHAGCHSNLRLVNSARIRHWRRASSKREGGLGTEEKEREKDNKKAAENGASSGERENGLPPGPLADIAQAAESVTEAATEVLHEVELATESLQSLIEEVPAPVAPISEQKTALITVAFWVAAAAVFGAGVGIVQGPGKASEYFAGYILEQSLSVDNLFVFVLIFKYFQVPLDYQNRVLSWGIAGAVVFRALLIGLGAATVQEFTAVNLVFAGILLFSSFKLLQGDDDEDEDLSDNYIVKTCSKLINSTDYYDGNNFFTVVDGVKRATPLLLTLAVVELSDIAFAVDSIPAVFGVTHDPFIVFSSNIFAIICLRSLYTLVAGVMKDLRFLQPSIAIVLGFVGAKLIAEFAGLQVPTESSLAVVIGVLGSGIFLSLKFPEEKED